jgi:RNA polymerase sigma-70 factor, ECF subfamily
MSARFGRENRNELFTGLYNESFEYVYLYVFARTGGDRQLTEEIVQETFAAAWLSLDMFNKKSSYRTWLCSIAKNKLRESYRRAVYKEKLELPDNESLEKQASSIDIEKAALENETRFNVLKVLEELNPLYRYALIMKYIDGLSVKEIATVFCRSPKAVDGVLQRAKAVFEKAYMKLEGSDGNER